MPNPINRPSQEPPETKFWSWFERNRARFSLGEADVEEMLAELDEKLTEYKEGLVFEVSEEHDGVRELVISADGVRESFAAVYKLTEFAPAIPGWQVTAFRPRMEDYMACTCTYEGREFDPKRVWFYAVHEEDQLDFIFYHPDYREADREFIASGTYILLDMAIGERDVVCGIRYLDHQRLPKDPRAEGLKHFSEFRGFFDANVKRV